MVKSRSARFMLAGTLAAALPFADSQAQELLPSADGPSSTDAPASADNEDILVIGSKMRKVRLNYALWGAHMKRCDVELSSGDENIDRFVCMVLETCIRDNFRDPVSAKTCLEDRIASVSYRPVQSGDGTNAATGDTLPKHLAGSLPSSVEPITPPDGQNAHTGITVLGSRPSMTPGLWQIDRSAVIPERLTPGSRPLPPRTYSLCIFPGKLDQALESLVSISIENAPYIRCTRMNVRIRNGKVTGRQSCNMANSSSNHELHGKVMGAAIEAVMISTWETERSRARWRAQLKGRRIGDCPS